MKPSPQPAALSAPPVSDATLAKYARLVYQHAGIQLTPQKKMLLANRLRRRLRVTGISSFEAYYEHLRKLPTRHPEWDAFLQEITTHETYLFRDEAQWAWFRREFLVDISRKARSGSRARQLRIWSAACSTGDEVYTTAACIVDALEGFSSWKIDILGTDIGVEALARAKEPLFSARAMHLVPPEIRRKHFVKQPDADVWRPKREMCQLVRFQHHNLMQPLAERPFDLIILKNVLIYFDGASKRTVVGNVRRVLAPGGLLVAGGAEGIGDLIRDMRQLKPWLYRQENPGGTPS